MKTINFKCDQCVLALVGEYPKIAEHSTEYIEVCFDMCPDWQSMVVVAAMFELTDGSMREPKKVLVENGVCRVPAEVLRYPGLTFSLWGTDGASVHMTTNLVQVPVMRNNQRSTYPQPSTPDMFDAILAASNAALEAAEEVTRRADSGEFNGKDFYYWKTYLSVADMQADFANIPDGSFVNINTGDVEDADDSKVYYKSDGELTFTADHSGKRGVQGEKGGSVSIKGRFETYDDLIAKHPVGDEGDAYLVGAKLYVWVVETNAWENMGDFEGPKGDDGEGIPEGGTAGQVLTKTETGTEWQDAQETATLESIGAAAKDHGHDAATQAADGFMSAADKKKLDDIATNANNYVHPTTEGNKHIPAGGASGQILRWSAAGTATWGADNNTTYSVATTSANGLMAAADKTKLNGIAANAGKAVQLWSGTWTSGKITVANVSNYNVLLFIVLSVDVYLPILVTNDKDTGWIVGGVCHPTGFDGCFRTTSIGMSRSGNALTYLGVAKNGIEQVDCRGDLNSVSGIRSKLPVKRIYGIDI